MEKCLIVSTTLNSWPGGATYARIRGDKNESMTTNRICASDYNLYVLLIPESSSESGTQSSQRGVGRDLL